MQRIYGNKIQEQFSTYVVYLYIYIYIIKREMTNEKEKHTYAFAKHKNRNEKYLTFRKSNNANLT